MKKYRNLDKVWKEIIFAAAGFGPNLLMVLMGAFFTDAVNPAALDLGSNSSKVVQTITGTCLVAPALFPILMFIAKAFDGIVDVPFASLTDNSRSKFGKRRLPIVICFIPMVVSFLMCWIPLSSTNLTLNTLWFFGWCLIFFATYTMSLIAFYGSLSTVCYNDKQRLRVSSFKSFFDTITYIMVYALVPLILGISGLHIDKLVFILMPTMLTMLIPVFMIKEGEKWEKKAQLLGYEIVKEPEESNVSLIESIKLTFTNKPFLRWCVVNCCSFFALQMFLVSMNALILGGMGMTSTQMAILNTCAFAPVPIMLYLFKKISDKKGLRFAYQSCLLTFCVAILSFILGSTYVMGDKTMVKILIGVLGGLFGSWSIGAFFMMPYMIPAQISSVEEKLTKKNHSAMYFAAQALLTSIIGAVASSFVYENIKTLFISKDASGIVSAIDEAGMTAAEVAATKLGVAVESVYNLGTLLVPIFVAVFCFGGFLLAYRMPKNYSPREVSKCLGLEKEYEENKHLFPEEKLVPFEAESLVVNNSLWVLSGSIFGYIWSYQLLKAVNTFASKKIRVWNVILSILFLPYGIYLVYMLKKAIDEKGINENLYKKKTSILPCIFAALGLSCISLSMLQIRLNIIANAVNKED